MATLSRWVKRTPAWLDNDKAEAPFQVEVRRLTVEEYRAFQAACYRISTGEEEATPEHIQEVFAPTVRGPVGTLEIDGQTIGTLAELLAAGMDEASAKDGLLADLVRLVIAVNRPTEKVLGESSGRPGSDTTRPPTQSEAGPDAPGVGA